MLLTNAADLAEILRSVRHKQPDKVSEPDHCARIASVLWQHYCQPAPLSIKDIAADLGLSAGRVHVIRHDGLVRLRRAARVYGTAPFKVFSPLWRDLGIEEFPSRIMPERTPDGHVQVWLLYRPEPHHPDSPEEREMNLWVRRADVFSSRERAIAWLDALIGRSVTWERYAVLTGGWFPELWVGRLGHRRWWMVPAPIDPPGGVL